MKPAKEIIGWQAEKDYSLKLLSHPDSLETAGGTQVAPLVRVLTQSEAVDAARDLYLDLDKEAFEAQDRYKKYGARSIAYSTLAVLAGAIALYLPGSPPADEPSVEPAAEEAAQATEASAPEALPIRQVISQLKIPQKWVGPLRTALVFLSIVTGALAVYFRTLVGRGNLFELWMSLRRDAEIKRCEYFETVNTTPDPAPGDLPSREAHDLPTLRFEYFRRYQFDVQRIYFKYRGRKHEKAAGKFVGWGAGIAGVAALAAGLSGNPEALGGLTGLVALVAVLIPTIVTAQSSLSLLSQDQRHALRYRANSMRLEEMRGQIDHIRRDLASGSDHSANAFVKEVDALLLQELDVWKGAFTEEPVG